MVNNFKKSTTDLFVKFFCVFSLQVNFDITVFQVFWIMTAKNEKVL